MSTVRKTYARRSAPSKTNIICCRACLATDGRMFNMHECKLVDAFTRISGISMQQDKLPHHLCSCCAALLRRCASFQAKCGRAQLCLLSGLMQKDLTLEYVRSIDRVSNKLVDLMPSGVRTDDITENEDIKDTPEQHLNNVNDIDAINDTDTSNKDNNSTEYIKYMYDSNAEKKDSKMEIDNDPNEDVNDNACEDVGGFIVKDIEEIVKKKIKPVRKVIRQRKKRSDCKKKQGDVEKQKGEDVDASEKEPKKPNYRDTREYRLEVAEFESTYNVKVDILSKEEQLKEIEIRKQSEKYLDALFHCEECGRGFQVEGAFKNHRAKHEPSAGDHPCPLCGMRYRTNHMLLRHKETHRTRAVCRDCGFISRARSQAANHYRMHQGRKFHCQYCEKTCSTMSYYWTHVRLAHPTKHVACDMCGEMFIGLQGLRQHKSRIHSVYLSQNYQCKVCSTTFISSEALKRHSESVGEEQHREWAPCDMCGHNLPSEELLRQHKGEHHPKCDECHQTFIDAKSYWTHYKRKHLGEKYDAVKAGTVRVRRRGHTARRGYSTREYMCERCGKMQKCYAILLEHQRRHENVRPFACHQCPKRFCTTTQYKAHMKTHTGARPFQCGHCSLWFTMKNNLERHILNKHLGKAPRVPCEICGRCFTAASSVKLHVRTVHGGEPWPRRDRRKPRPRPDTAADA